MYEGWKIYTYNRKISKEEEPIIKDKLKTWFDSGDFCFYPNTHRMVIFYGSDKLEIDVSFQETECGSRKDGNAVTYQIVFRSIPLGYKTFQERVHQELCKKTMRKIPWKKQAVWLVDNAQIPLPRIKRLRMK